MAMDTAQEILEEMKRIPILRSRICEFNKKKTPIFWSRKKAKARKTSGPHIIYIAYARNPEGNLRRK